MQRSRKLLQYLNPASAAAGGQKTLLPNSQSEPACPVYQRGVIESTTVDVGDRQMRAIIVQPHHSAPIMVSHQSKANDSYTLANLTESEGGRLRDVLANGRVAVSAIGGLETPFTSHEMPSHQVMPATAVLSLPIHGSYGIPINNACGSRIQPASVSFRDFTEVLNAGAPTGTRAIPVVPGDSVSLMAQFTCLTASFLSGDILVETLTCSSGGALTATTATLSPVTTHSAGQTCLASGSVVIPAGAVGLCEVRIRNNLGSARNYVWRTIVVGLQVNPLGGYDVSTGLGCFVGEPVSAARSFCAEANAIRTTALSALVTNTSSSLNANGFIIGVGCPRTIPSTCGITGSIEASNKTDSKTFKFIDGSYTAIAPADDLKYLPCDSAIPFELNRVVYYVSGQDNTPVSFKIEYNAICEVISTDPIFPPMRDATDDVLLDKLDAIADSHAYLIMSENSDHDAAILSSVGSSLGAVGMAGLASGNPFGMAAGGLAALAGAGLTLGGAIESAKTANKREKKQEREDAIDRDLRRLAMLKQLGVTPEVDYGKLLKSNAYTAQPAGTPQATQQVKKKSK